MTTQASALAGVAAQLRESFDESFARAPPTGRVAQEDFLLVRLASTRHVLRLGEIGRVASLQGLTRFPTPLPQLLGVTGVRGSLIPVYDLRACLDLPAGEAPRWLAVAVAAPLAFAFEAVDSYLRVPLGTTAPAEQLPDGGNHHVREILHHDGHALPVISVSSLVAAIQSAVQALPPARGA